MMKYFVIGSSYMYIIALFFVIVVTYRLKLDNKSIDTNSKSYKANYYTFMFSSWIPICKLLEYHSINVKLFSTIFVFACLLLPAKMFSKTMLKIIGDMGENFSFVFPIYFLWDNILKSDSIDNASFERDIGYVVYWFILTGMLILTIFKTLKESNISKKGEIINYRFGSMDKNKILDYIVEIGKHLLLLLIIVFLLFIIGFRIVYLPESKIDIDRTGNLAEWVSAIATILIPLIVVKYEKEIEKVKIKGDLANQALYEEIKMLKDALCGKEPIILDGGDATGFVKSSVLNYLKINSGGYIEDITDYLEQPQEKIEAALDDYIKEGNVTITYLKKKPYYQYNYKK